MKLGMCRVGGYLNGVHKKIIPVSNTNTAVSQTVEVIVLMP
jgi:hypothetical protein